MLSGYCEFTDGRLYFEVDGNGPPLIFIHGYALDNRIWDFQFEKLAKSYRVIRYDLRGFGKSSVPPTSPYSHHEDLRKLLEYLGITIVSIVGLSMGGLVGIDFSLCYPEMLHKLILVNSDIGGLKTNPGSRFYGSVEIGRQKWYEDPLLANALAMSTVAPNLRRMVDEYSGWHWANKDISRVNIDPPAIRRLSEIKVPCLVVSAENDTDYFKNASRILRQEIDGNKSFVIQGVGHILSMEAPTELYKAIQEFLNS